MTNQERNSKMAAIVKNWVESGLTQVEFARNHNVKLATLRYWIAKNRKASEHQPSFIQINGPVTSGIHIRYAHGVEVVLPYQTPLGLIRSLIQQ